MKFIQNVEISKYREFENKHKKSHFLQSYEWGQFCKRAKRQIPRYVGMEDNDGNLVATCLILLKSFIVPIISKEVHISLIKLLI